MNFFIFEASVVGANSKSSAAPPSPDTFQLQTSKAQMIFSRSFCFISESVRTFICSPAFAGFVFLGAIIVSEFGRSKRSLPDPDTIAALSTTFCSSRILPGQE